MWFPDIKRWRTDLLEIQEGLRLSDTEIYFIEEFLFVNFSSVAPVSYLSLFLSEEVFTRLV